MQVTYPFLQADHAPERLGTQVAGDWRIDLISDRLFGGRERRMLVARVEQRNGTYPHNIQRDRRSLPNPIGVAMFGINPGRRSQQVVENKTTGLQLPAGELVLNLGLAEPAASP
jgi:hypothetical protein